MFDGLISFSITTQTDPLVTIKGLQNSPESPLPPLLLLHGFPQTRHIWHRIVPHLTTTYKLIIPDLRGYGESSKPPSPAPLPETLISATPRKFAELCMGGKDGKGLDIFDKACYEEYVKLFEDEDTVHAMCNDYRAAATVDLDEQRADLEKGRLIKAPVRIIWGKKGVIEKCFDAMAEWRKVVGEGVVLDGYSVDSGHYIPEEAPDDVVKAVCEFFV
ncbi:Fluoroacetate dehalogenase [Metarhizium anisopliae]